MVASETIYVRGLGEVSAADVCRTRMSEAPPGAEFFECDEFPASLVVRSNGKVLGLISKRLVRGGA